MRVFFDAHVLVSAFTARGLCADLFKGTITSCTLVTSDPLLAELRRILSDKFGATPKDLDEVMGVVEEDADKAPVGDRLDIRIKERDDIRILSSAIHGKADNFVTGYKEVLALGNLGTMRILSPRDFWAVLRRN